jgi:hypothetical protein
MAAIDELEDFCMAFAHGVALLAHLAAKGGTGFKLFQNERAEFVSFGAKLVSLSPKLL